MVKIMSEISQRNVRMEDAKRIYQWSNDEEVRKNSFSKEPIEWEVHLKWMEKMLTDPFMVFRMICVDDEPVGMYRIQLIEKQGLISYSIAKEYRGLGYGRKCIQLIVRDFIDHYPQIEELVAYTKLDNVSSRKIFLKEGFKEHIQALEIRYTKKKEGIL